MTQRALPKEQQRKLAFKVGIYIVLITGFLVFVVMWLKNFSMRPEYTFIASFMEPPYITQGSAAYYKGVKVGRVNQVSLSPDHTRALVHIAISEDNLKLPVNAQVSVRTEGITGVTYILISLPIDQPIAKAYIQDGDVVEGVEPFNLARLEQRITKWAEDGRLEEIVDNTREALREVRGLVGDYRRVAQKTSGFLDRASTVANSTEQLMASANGAVTQFQSAAADTSRAARRMSNLVESQEPAVREIVANARGATASVNQFLAGDVDPANGQPRTGNEIRNTLGSLRDTTQSVRSAAAAWERSAQAFESTVGDIHADLTQTRLIPKLAVSVEQLGVTGQRVGSVLGGLSASGGLSGGANVVQNINRTVNRFDCLQTGVADILDDRFLLFKLMFGKPGAGLAECQNNFGQSGMRVVSPAAPSRRVPTPTPVREDLKHLP